MDVNAIVWTDKYSVGHEVLDRQHKKLIAIMNKLVEHRSLSADSEVISDVINELMNYVREHFDREEQILASVGYPQLQHHHQEHIVLVESLSEIMLAAIGEEQTVPDELIRLLQEWICHHILEEDRAYADYLNR